MEMAGVNIADWLPQQSEKKSVYNNNNTDNNDKISEHIELIYTVF